MIIMKELISDYSFTSDEYDVFVIILYLIYRFPNRIGNAMVAIIFLSYLLLIYLILLMLTCYYKMVISVILK